jgi:hypothetical protein
LSKNGFKTNNDIKEQRAKEGKGLLLIYALDERGTPNLNTGIPVLGYSLHFPKINGEKTVSYTVTLNKEFEEELTEDDDIQEKE